MSQKSSKIILSKNIKIDKNYKQVLSFTESQMLSLLQDNNNLVYQSLSYSFIRDRGSIKVNAPYGTCLQSNYMAFQNPDFSNKWFFAFIDKVVYLSDSASEIYYTIDEWSTWFDYWNPKECFVIREHVTSDNIGEHTEPEKLEHGSYVGNGALIGDSRFSTYAYLVVTTQLLESATPTTIYTSLGGIIMNGFVYFCNNLTEVEDRINDSLQQKDNSVLFVYMIPSIIVPSSQIGSQKGLITSYTTPYHANYTPISSIPTTLDGYSPVNKKLLCYPYQYCLMENTAGSSNVLRYEWFSGTNHPVEIWYYAVPSIGASIIAIPHNYRGNVLALDEAIVGPKYPTLPWSEDAYTNWLTQNSVNNTMNWVKAGGQVILGAGMLAGGVALASTGVGATLTPGLMASGASTLASGGLTAFDNSMEYYQHSQEPDIFKGVNSAGDVLTCIGAMGFNYLKMSIEGDYARKLDKFFTRYGYTVNTVKYPNMSHRQNYNYLQISKDDNIGYVNNHNGISIPASSMELINTIVRNGVTIWNNHTNLGDYSVSNNITN